MPLGSATTVSGVRVLRAAACGAARASVPHRAGERRRRVAHLDRRRIRADADGLPDSLIAAVVGDLVRRGVRALEAFGRTAEVTELLDPRLVSPELRPVVEVLGDCSVDQCVHRRRLLAGGGLRRRRAAPVLPAAAARARQGLGWKADVEAALERLLESAQLQQPVGAGVAPVRSSGSGRLTRPACSTDSSCASSSAKVNVPVGRSFLPSRYSRLTAARMPSAIESRVWVDTSMARSRGLVM